MIYKLQPDSEIDGLGIVGFTAEQFDRLNFTEDGCAVLGVLEGELKLRFFCK
jgi:hypothetical protein